MFSLFVAAIFFAGIHLGVSGTDMRDRLVAKIGQPAYMILFSLASLAGLLWLINAYQGAPYLETWGQPAFWKPVAVVLMLPAFLLAVIGLTTPNPTSVAQEALVAKPPQGIVCVTRHPFLMGTALWALVHLVANGDVASLLLFGSLAVVALVGTVSIDAKRRRSLGAPAWEAFASKTSIIPFAAILAGRTTFSVKDLGRWRPAAGVIAYVLMLGGHAHIVGVSPFP
jgi:uncharacterized membrane protein